MIVRGHRLIRQCPTKTRLLPKPMAVGDIIPLESNSSKRDGLISWLQTARRMGEEPAKDVVSRIKRAERIIGRPIAALMRDGSTVDDITIALRAGMNRLAMDKDAMDRTQQVLRGAINAYIAYENS